MVYIVQKKILSARKRKNNPIFNDIQSIKKNVIILK